METLFEESSLWTCGDLNCFNSEDIFSLTSNMTGFSLSPFDPEPLPTVPPQSSDNYKENQFLRDKSELPDVLFSFKGSPQVGLTVGPGQGSPMPTYAGNTYGGSQQMLSPNGYSPNYCIEQSFGPTGNGSTANFAATFPAMSVNVSMNMTMGYLPTDPTLPLQHQMQWPTGGGGQIGAQSTPSYSSYHGNSPTQNYCHQPYSATYSFAADFRPESSIDNRRSQWIPPPSILHSNGTSPGDRSFTSSKKQRSTRSSGSLSPSIGSFGTKSNLCRICGKTYARPSTLKTHLRTHSGEKPYRCAECHKSFSQAANLTAHVRTHSGEKPFRCPICDRKFSQSSSVTTHMRTHSGERPYRCRLCKKAFSDSSTLTKHLRIHSGEKPYQCKICLLRFSQSGNLNRHMRVHSSPS